MPLDLDYYYGNEAEQYSFYRIPKALFSDRRFQSVSVEAKVLYGLLLDRMGLSVKNGWLDEDGRVYIIYTIVDIMETLGCAEQKANKLLGELDCARGIGLIERKRRGLGKPNVIYVKNFTDRRRIPQGRGQGGVPASPGEPPEGREPETQESQFLICENHNSGIVNITSQEMRKSQTNNTDLNKTDLSENPSIYPESGISRAGGMADRIDELANGCAGGEGDGDSCPLNLYRAYRDIIRTNIDYDILAERYPHDRERLDGFVELMAEVCCRSRGTVRINQDDMGVDVVRERLLKLHSGHIEYVMDCLDKNTTLVGNIRAYTLSALFNAPATMSQYYASLVSHDMASGRFGGG